jgi:hypothetical protein
MGVWLKFEIPAYGMQVKSKTGLKSAEFQI